MSESDLLDAILSTPEIEKPKPQPQPKPETKPKKKKKKKVRSGTRVVPDGYLTISREELQRMLEEAVKKGLEEGFRRAREPNEKNVVLAIWNSEPSGVKLSNLAIVFGRENAAQVQRILETLRNKNVLVKDRNNWWHINPRFINVILAHYQIEFDMDDIQLIRTRLKKRFGRWQFGAPDL